ncbi:aldehyde dehydrogenase [Paraphaeosphaeria sporulosa]
MYAHCSLGVIQIVSGDSKVGLMLASHMDINKISFTGSAFDGNEVQELAAKSNLKCVVLELGGRSTSLIFSDANLKNAIQHHSRGFLFNTAQACIVASRTFIEESIAPKSIEKLKMRYEELAHATGDPADSKTY